MVAKLTEINDILKILRANGVQEFKNEDLHVILGARASLSEPMINTEKFEPPNTNQENEDDLYHSGV
jgi:hypothetical protein